MTSIIDEKTFFVKPYRYSAMKIESGIASEKAVKMAIIDVEIEPIMGAMSPYSSCSGFQMFDINSLIPKICIESKDIEEITRIVKTKKHKRVVAGGRRR
jgi:hypothetical protein